MIHKLQPLPYEYNALEPDQKETLYVFDGIKNNIPVQVISDHINRSPGWVRNTASVLLFFLSE